MVPGKFQIRTNFLQVLFMQIIETKNISCTTIDCKGNVSTCATREVDHNYYGVDLVKTTTGREAILIID